MPIFSKWQAFNLFLYGNFYNGGRHCGIFTLGEFCLPNIMFKCWSKACSLPLSSLSFRSLTKILSSNDNRNKSKGSSMRACTIASPALLSGIAIFSKTKLFIINTVLLFLIFWNLTRKGAFKQFSLQNSLCLKYSGLIWTH